MASPNNTKILITIPISLKTKVEQRAEAENRSTSNMIITILLKEFGVLREE